MTQEKHKETAGTDSQSLRQRIMDAAPRGNVQVPRGLAAVHLLTRKDDLLALQKKIPAYEAAAQAIGEVEYVDSSKEPVKRGRTDFTSEANATTSFDALDAERATLRKSLIANRNTVEQVNHYFEANDPMNPASVSKQLSAIIQKAFSSGRSYRDTVEHLWNNRLDVSLENGIRTLDEALAALLDSRRFSDSDTPRETVTQTFDQAKTALKDAYAALTSFMLRARVLHEKVLPQYDQPLRECEAGTRDILSQCEGGILENPKELFTLDPTDHRWPPTGSVAVQLLRRDLLRSFQGYGPGHGFGVPPDDCIATYATAGLAKAAEEQGTLMDLPGVEKAWVEAYKSSLKPQPEASPAGVVARQESVTTDNTSWLRRLFGGRANPKK